MWHNRGGASCKDMPWLTSANEKRSNEGIRPIFWSGRPKSYLMVCNFSKSKKKKTFFTYFSL